MYRKQILASYDIENDSSAFDIKKDVKSLKFIGNFPLGLMHSNAVVNASVVSTKMERKKVKETLKMFWDLYKELLDQYRREQKHERNCTRRFDMEAAKCLKMKGKWMHSLKLFGHIPGITIGDKFHFRVELAIVGLHCQYVSGIDYTMLDGKKVATSVVNSGRYDNKARTNDVLIYSGQGGLLSRGHKADQKLTLGNLALVNSMELKYPVRVIRKTLSVSKDFAYTYDGLYEVKKYWRERDNHGKLVFKFELHRKLDQQETQGSRKSKHEECGAADDVSQVENYLRIRKLKRKECCVVDDVSQGKEIFQVRAMNGIDSERPEKFAYITKTIYPEWCKKLQHSGCNCTDGCSNFGQCVCVLKNGGEMLFSERDVLRQKAIVYHCGPSCKCPPSCKNRVSQHNPRYQLELYKTESRGWSLRSRSYISSGSFVCELVGILKEIKNDKQDLRRFSKFIISKSSNHNFSNSVEISRYSRSDENGTMFVIDASKVGNLGRFIRHSNSPTLVMQHIIYSQDDGVVPHVMFFAAKNIPPLHELTCDYDNPMMARV